MQLLTIFATVFCGGMVLVFADYYIEYETQAPAAPSSSRSRRQPVEMIINLYHCRGTQATQQAIAAVESRCTPVPPAQEDTIYTSCNFYNVHNPNLQGHAIELCTNSAIPLGYMSNNIWNLGYLNQAIDHPNFAEPSQEVVAFHRTRMLNLGSDIVPHYMAKGLATYYAQDNLIAFSRNPVIANSLFLGFKTFLERIMDKYAATARETNRRKAAELRASLESAVRVALLKMIDPCSVLDGNLQRFASGYCATYCNFLNFASRLFPTSANRCSVENGNCVGAVCTCNRVLSHPFAGCPAQSSDTTPMQLCHNYMRTENHL